WYGVRQTTVTVCEIDLRVGGKWRWVVSRPGLEVAFSGVFQEIDAPRLLRRTEWFEAIPGAESVVTLTFDEQEGQTMLIMHMRFADKVGRDMCLQSGMELGIRECFQKIDELIASA